MRYTIAEHSDTISLTALVQQLLNNGWELYGSLVVSGEGANRRYAQPWRTNETHRMNPHRQKR